LGPDQPDLKFDLKDYLHRYLRSCRDALLWKLDGLSEYDVRRPMVRTGTNLLGLVKHLSNVEAGYFGVTFGRPFAELAQWYETDLEPNADMWATPAETREQVVDLYRRVWVHADATIDGLPLDTVGSVPWWPESEREVTLERVLVDMIGETERHAGHADIVRELIDGSAGWRPRNDLLAAGDEVWWAAYRQRLEEAARRAEEP